MDSDHAHSLLARERTRVEQAIADLVPDDNRDVDDADPGEPAPLQDELEQGLLETLRTDLAAIGRAEQRLADGRFGVSVDSGEPIPDARLEIVPWAERTVAEEERLGA